MRLFLMIALFFSLSATANDSTRLYKPFANVAKDIEGALAKARKENKHVLIQVGGNWCVMCYRLNSLMHSDTTLKKLMNDNYVVYHLNYSKENRNLDYLKKLGYPQRFGFPVLVVLDKNGKRIHTQDSGLLQKGNGYDAGKIKSFLKNRAPGAADEALYKP